MAGTDPDSPPYDNWVFENNHVYDNNLPNSAPSGTMESSLQPGVGLLLIGSSEHTIKGNVFEDNGWAGVRKKVCQLLFDYFCVVGPPFSFVYFSSNFFSHFFSFSLHRSSLQGSAPSNNWLFKVTV